MADETRSVDVVVNVVGGSSAGMQQQAQAQAQGAQRQADILAQAQQQLARQEEASAVQKQVRILKAQREVAAAGGFIPQDKITAMKPQQGPPGVGSQLLAAGQGLASGGAAGMLGALGASSIPAVGVAVGAIGALGGAAQMLRDTFGTVRDSAESFGAALRQQESDLRGARSSGVADVEALRRALSPQQQQQLAAAQNAGDMGRQRQILEAARAGMQPAAATAPQSAERIAQLQAALTAIEETTRSASYRAGQAAGMGVTPEMLRRQAFERFAPAGEAAPSFGNAQATAAQIQEWARLAGGQATRAQAGIATINAATGPGGVIPSLRAGAPNLSEMPQMFQSRQGDVLDLHAQIQQEAVRDQREQARFDAQIRLWEDILREMRRIGNTSFPAPVGPP